MVSSLPMLVCCWWNFSLSFFFVDHLSLRTGEWRASIIIGFASFLPINSTISRLQQSPSAANTRGNHFPLLRWFWCFFYANFDQWSLFKTPLWYVIVGRLPVYQQSKIGNCRKVTTEQPRRPTNKGIGEEAAAWLYMASYRWSIDGSV